MTPQFFSVSDFVSYINDTLKAIWDGDMVAIEGEVSGLRISQGQWVNFDIKDGVLSRFGFDVNSQEFEDAIDTIKNLTH